MYKRKILSSYNNDIQYHLKMTQSWQYKKFIEMQSALSSSVFSFFIPTDSVSILEMCP